MEKTKAEFVHFIRDATTNKQSDAFRELYSFLVGCFVRADANRDGAVDLVEFDALVEEAAALPRRYGFAPKSSDMYKSDADRKAARANQFKTIDTAGVGSISLEQWIEYSVTHIYGKAKTLPKDYLAGSDITRDEFIAFIRNAVKTNTPEYEDLYFFLLKCFQAADDDKDGAVRPAEFDVMIEQAAASPRRFGLAPPTNSLFKNEAERLAARTKYFLTMDLNQDGKISFNEWLKYAVDHIVGKVATL